MPPTTKSKELEELLEGIDYREYPELLPRQNEAYGKIVTTRPGKYTILGYGGGMGGVSRSSSPP